MHTQGVEHKTAVSSYLFDSQLVKEAPSKPIHDVTQHIQRERVWVKQVDADLSYCNASLRLSRSVHQKQPACIPTQLRGLPDAIIWKLVLCRCTELELAIIVNMPGQHAPYF